LSLFGSVLRDAFTPESDVDVLVSFDPDATWSLWDFTEMRDELGALVGRPVDLVEREGLRNPFRRDKIMQTRKVIYVGQEG
jgi:predicted nucleotidyltransferase